MGTLKTEILQSGCFIDEPDARTELFSFIEGYYNTLRKHSSLDYRSPGQSEADLDPPKTTNTRSKNPLPLNFPQWNATHR